LWHWDFRIFGFCEALFGKAPEEASPMPFLVQVGLNPQETQIMLPEAAALRMIRLLPRARVTCPSGHVLLLPSRATTNRPPTPWQEVLHVLRWFLWRCCQSIPGHAIRWLCSDIQ
jgi:hypothetical protein